MNFIKRHTTISLGVLSLVVVLAVAVLSLNLWSSNREFTAALAQSEEKVGKLSQQVSLLNKQYTEKLLLAELAASFLDYQGENAEPEVRNVIYGTGSSSATVSFLPDDPRGQVWELVVTGRRTRVTYQRWGDPYILLSRTIQNW